MHTIGMGRIGLALVLLIGLGAVARADRAICASPLAEGDITRGELFPSMKLELEPDPTDKTPPAAPTGLTVAVTADAADTWVSLTGTYDPDTAYIRAVFDGYQLFTTPDRLVVCTHDKIKAGSHVRVVAYDKSQNASDYVDANVVEIQNHEPEWSHHHGLHGMDILITIGAIVLAAAELVLLVLYGFARKKAPFSVAGEFLSPILAENVARIVARGYVIKLAVAMAIIMGLLALHHPNIAILVGPFAVVWLFELFLTRLVIGQFDNKIQRLEKRENWIYINSSKLYAPHKTWEKASALPAASLTTRE